MERTIRVKGKGKISVKPDTIKKILGKVLYELAHCDVKVKFNINYTVKDKEKVKNDLLEKAVEDSTTKAKVLAKASGVKLKEILNIDYSWGEIDIYSSPMDDWMVCEAKSSYDIDIEADDIDVQDTVTITWTIE